MHTKDEKRQKVFRVFETISAGYDRANGRISLGLEKHWKQALTKAVSDAVPPRGAVLDICCGTGDIALAIAGKRPDISVTGLDFSPAMLAVAAKKSRTQQQNISWQQGDALCLPFQDNSFSAVTISFGLRNTADYGLVLREMRRVTKPGGRLYCLDSYVPENRWVQPFYKLYFHHVMPFLGGGWTHREAYRWLSESTAQFVSGKKLSALCRDSGWKNVKEKPFLFGSCVLHEACRGDEK